MKLHLFSVNRVIEGLRYEANLVSLSARKIQVLFSVFVIQRGFNSCFGENLEKGKLKSRLALKEKNNKCKSAASLPFNLIQNENSKQKSESTLKPIFFSYYQNFKMCFQ